jgi:hypothetical protein
MNVPFACVVLALATSSLVASRSSSPGLGPPLLCHEFAIDGAKSLPWKGGTEGDKAYDRRKLVEDVARILKTEESLIVRMETLRRATLYTRGDRALAWELLGRAGLATLEQAAIGSKESTAWFDAGFLAACLEQLGTDLGFRAGVAEDQEGYAYLLRALERARSEHAEQIATIEFAAALVVHPVMRKGPTSEDVARYRRHIEAARAGAAPGSLLARNMAAHAERFDNGKERWAGPQR